MSHLPLRQIELTVADSDELFDRLDPSARRHLDERVEQFIVHHAQEGRGEYSLLVRVPGGPLSPEDAAALSADIRAHFAHRTDEERQKLQGLVRAGRRDLAIGIIFLFVCAAVGLIAVSVMPTTVGLFVEQGLMILGWVALWRPFDLFLYELRPLRLHRNLLNRLSAMDVWFQPRTQSRPRAVAV